MLAYYAIPAPRKLCYQSFENYRTEFHKQRCRILAHAKLYSYKWRHTIIRDKTKDAFVYRIYIANYRTYIANYRTYITIYCIYITFIAYIKWISHICDNYRIYMRNIAHTLYIIEYCNVCPPYWVDSLQRVLFKALGRPAGLGTGTEYHFRGRQRRSLCMWSCSVVALEFRTWLFHGIFAA